MKKQAWICATLLMGLLVLRIGAAQAEIDPATAQKLLANDGVYSDEFGGAVSVSGDTALIGAWNDDDKGEASGSAYIFVRSSDGKWKQQAKLTANDGAANDMFGMSVSLDGDTALIGATYDDDKGDSSGAAYIFVRSSSVVCSKQSSLQTTEENLISLAAPSH